MKNTDSEFENVIRGSPQCSILGPLLFNLSINVRKNTFACLFSVHNTISLSCHEHVV